MKLASFARTITIAATCALALSVSAQEPEATTTVPVNENIAQFAPADPLYYQGRVTEIVETTYPIFQGREIEFQTLEVELSDGTVRTDVYNDYTPVEVGDTVYLTLSYEPATQSEGLFVVEVQRMASLGWVFVVFALVYLAVAGIKGLRSLGSLVLAVGAVWFVLLPALQMGQDPLLVGAGISALILGVAIFITHGFTVVSLVSYVGSLIAIGITILFASWSMDTSTISGWAGDYAMQLSLLYGPSFDVYRLLLAGMIIGLLGVLDDVAVMQAAVVREFMADRQGQSIWSVFARAMRVGREHAAALVNTLVLAYTAVALPMLLVVFAPSMQQMGEYTVPLGMTLSNELFAVEFIRSMVGSLGLVLTVPIVTLLAVLLYAKFPPRGDREVHAHTHSH